MAWSISTFRSSAEDSIRRYRDEAEAVVEAAKTQVAKLRTGGENGNNAPKEAIAASSQAATRHADQAAIDFARNARSLITAKGPVMLGKPPQAPPPAASEPSVPNPTFEKARPQVMFAAGTLSGLATGHLGPGGAIAQHVIDSYVDRNGTKADKYNFGGGQVLAGTLVAAEGVALSAGGGSLEVGTVGFATPVAVPAMALGAVEIGVGASHIAGGASLMSKGAPASTPPTSTPSPPSTAPTTHPSNAPTSAAPASAGPTSAVPTAAATAPKPTIHIDHVLNGEINKKGKAVGYHWRGGTNTNARIVDGTKTPLDAHGTYEAKIEVFDTAQNKWVAKKTPSTFFPDGYSRTDVETAVHEAFASPNKTVIGNQWEGTTSSGMKIQGYVDSSGNITSAYPLHGQ